MNNQKVSIVVPVYNAEKYLGYTISSIIKQTYRNIEIILINDGSTDDSLQICRNYAEIDERIRVIDIPNGGVSRARNRGIEEATGRYIQFVDSDDVIAETMTGQLVNVMELYDTDMVVCGMKYVLLEGNRVLKMEDWLPDYLGKECVLSQRMFLEDFSRILLYTVLLEGPCNKLYKKEYFEEKNIRFPEGRELGEDFLLNLQYFREMKRVVFISDVLYYYVQWNSESLTQCYRSNLFENQISLIEEYENFLHEQHVWEKENVEYFYQYVAGYIIRCLKSLFDERIVWSEDKIKLELYRMMSHEKVELWIQQAECMPEKFEWLKDCIGTMDVGTVYEKLKDLKECSRRKKEIELAEKELETCCPGQVNMRINYMLRRINNILDSRRIRKTIVSLEQAGIMATITRIGGSCRNRVSKKMLRK